MITSNLFLAALLPMAFGANTDDVATVIPFSKSSGSFTKPGTDLLDFDAVAAHLNEVHDSYASKLHGNISAAGMLRKRQSATVVFDAQWSGLVTIGTPGQQKNVSFSTSSSDFILSKSAYNPAKSSTAKDTGKKYSQSFANGNSAAGPIYTDVAQVGSTSATVTIGLAEDNSVTQDGIGGLLGLGPPEGAAFPTATTFAQSFQNKWAEPAYYIDGNAGKLVFGAGAPGATYVSTSRNFPHFWSAKASINHIDSFGIFDNSNGAITMDMPLAKKLFAELGLKTFEQNNFLFAQYDCEKPPAVSAAFGAIKINFDPKALFFGKKPDGACVLRVAGDDLSRIFGSPVISFGFPLFEEALITFDLRKKRIGFSPLKSTHTDSTA